MIRKLVIKKTIILYLSIWAKSNISCKLQISFDEITFWRDVKLKNFLRSLIIFISVVILRVVENSEFLQTFFQKVNSSKYVESRDGNPLQSTNKLLFIWMLNSLKNFLLFKSIRTTLLTCFNPHFLYYKCWLVYLLQCFWNRIGNIYFWYFPCILFLCLYTMFLICTVVYSILYILLCYQ